MRWMMLLLASLLVACSTRGTAPPPAGWANTAPTVVTEAVDRGERQLLQVSQGDLSTWVSVPDVDAAPGDHVLLGQGTPRADVSIPERGETVPLVVDIAHVQVVDAETARRVISARAPAEAVPIGTLYAELGERAGQEVLVHGVVVKSTDAVGWVWVHVQDGSGSADDGTHDLTVRTTEMLAKGQRVAFRGTLAQDVDLGFGYHYDAMLVDVEQVGTP